MLKNNKWMKASALTAILAGTLLTACGGDSGGDSGGGSGSVDIIYPTENITITKKNAQNFVVKFSTKSGNYKYLLNGELLDGVFSDVVAGKATAEFAELKRYIKEGGNTFRAQYADGNSEVKFIADIVSGAVIITSVGDPVTIPTSGDVIISGVTRELGLDSVSIKIGDKTDFANVTDENFNATIIFPSQLNTEDNKPDFTFVAKYDEGDSIPTYIAANGRKFNSLGALQIPSDAGDQWLKDLILAGGLSDIDDASDAVITEEDGSEDVSENTLKPTIDVISTTDSAGDTFIKLSGGVEVVVGPNGAGSIQPALGSFMDIQEPNFNEYGDLGDSGIKLALSENMLNQQIMALYQSGELNEILQRSLGGEREIPLGEQSILYVDVDISIKSVPSVKLFSDKTLALMTPQIEANIFLSSSRHPDIETLYGFPINPGDRLITAIIDLDTTMNLGLNDKKLPSLNTSPEQVFITVVDFPFIFRKSEIELALELGLVEGFEEYKSVEDLKSLLESAMQADIAKKLKVIGGSLIKGIPVLAFDIEKMTYKEGSSAADFRDDLPRTYELNLESIDVSQDETYILFGGELAEESSSISESLVKLKFCSSSLDVPDAAKCPQKK